MDYTERPVFIVASERSGTNLLRKRLTDAQSIYLGPSPAHLLKHLYYQQPYYGDLSQDVNFLAFLNQALDLCLVHFSPWDIDWTKESLLRDFGERKREAISLMHFMMNKYALEKGYQGYICKDNFLYEFALDIAQEIPGAKFIYLYRDPRDFVLSQNKRPRAIRSTLLHAKLWSYEQTKSIQAATKLKSLGRCSWVSYEHLITNEEQVVSQLLDYLCVEIDRKSIYKENEAVKVHDWKNLNKPTDSSNSGKYRSEMKSFQIKIIEQECDLQMSFLGYEPDFKSKDPFLSFLKYGDHVFALVRKAVSKLLARSSNGLSEEAEIRNRRSSVLRRISVNYRSDS